VIVLISIFNLVKRDALVANVSVNCVVSPAYISQSLDSKALIACKLSFSVCRWSHSNNFSSKAIES
jgi:hypothetical protein